MDKKRTAIISGGCGDIGRAIGSKLAKDGFDVIALYHKTPRDIAESIVQNFAPGDHRAVACDIQNAKAVAEVIRDITDAGRTIGLCVHAAVDPILRKGILDIDASELTAQLATGLFGGFHLFTQTARVMKQIGNPGALVGILSPVVDPGRTYAAMSGYSVEKHALRGLLKELHHELASSNITVNAVSPNFMDTKLNKDLPPAVRQFMIAHLPKEGLNTPEDVARAIGFLASENGRATNGKIFSFDQKTMAAL